jgi:hypothetical protein
MLVADVLGMFAFIHQFKHARRKVKLFIDNNLCSPVFLENTFFIIPEKLIGWCNAKIT